MDIFDVYSLYDIEPVTGRGNYVFTADGTRYLDLYGGHAVISVGHSHPRYTQALKEQIDRLGFYSNSVKNRLQTELALKLGRVSDYGDYSLFLCNSGAEANENAVKVASWATGRPGVLAISGAFHGRTSGAVALTDNRALSSPFNITPNVDFAAWDNLDEVDRKLATGHFGAVIIEGIQGVSGIHVPADSFMTGLRDLTTRHGAALIVDEVQSGYGRTGRFFAHQHSGIVPDLITVAKGMGNGFPVGGVLISPRFKARKGMLGTTFGGNHLACAAAIAVLDIIESEGLVGNAAATGKAALEKLGEMAGNWPEAVREVRGRGLMIGIELNGANAAEVRRRLLFDNRIFTGGAGASTIRLLPALTADTAMIDEFITALTQQLKTQ